MRSNSHSRIKKEIANEAAKLVALHGYNDYLLAKKKAAGQLGIHNQRLLPSNSEIESALIEYQNLFQTHDEQCLDNMRNVACKTMNLLNDYAPRLVGSVLSGTASQHSEITIHLFADAPEVIAVIMDEKRIPLEVCERRVMIERNKPAYFTSFKFIAGEYKLVLIVLPEKYSKLSPIDPITDKAMKHASLSKVRKLLD